jgi:hypothetical protein
MGIMDGCNILPQSDIIGIGKGKEPPSTDFVDFVYEGFRAMEKGVANEVLGLIKFFNEHYVKDDFNRIDFSTVQEIARTCVTGCAIVDSGPIELVPVYNGFSSRLTQCAYKGTGI